MKKYVLGSLVLSLFAISLFIGWDISAQSVQLLASEDDRIISTDRNPKDEVTMVSPNLVISQFQAGGGVADDEFVEIHNIGPLAVDLNGWVLVYRSSSGVADVGPFASWTTSTIIQPGQFYLIASTSYDGGATPNLTWSPGSSGSMAAGAGGLALRQGAVNTGTIIDAVGWGSATNIFFEGTRTAAPGNNNSQRRLDNGCKDTDNNLSDFANVIPSVPRNAATTPVVCSGGGTTLFAAMAASPTTVVPSGTTLLTVTVIPATTPPSTAIQVTGNLTQIGGSATQNFVDDGTGGDVTAGDNVFTYLASIPVGQAGGVYNLTAVASDAEMRFVNLNQNVTVSTAPESDDPLLFGNPSNATANVANENNYLMTKPQYSLSYNRSKATANWTAWRLDSTWIGGADRQNDFRGDTTLPAGWYQVQPSDYSEPVYDRGHLCPSGDRTRSVPDNSATFLMTNMIPQHPDNNQGPWEEFETYCRTLAGQGKEIYIYMGPHGQDINAGGGTGFIGNGVMVPASTWKVVLVIDNGTNDLQRVGKKARMFGIVVSNIPPINRNAPWRNFRVTVDQVETLTGYDFFSNLNPRLQARMESSPDTQ